MKALLTRGLFVLLAALVPLSAACGPTATGAASAPSSANAPAVAAGDPMAQLVAAAKKEGRVVMSGTLTTEGRQAITESFQKAYGIAVDFQGINSAEFMARADREFKANAVSFDLAFGVSNCYQMAEKGQIEDMKGVLIDPTVTDPSVWEGGGPGLFSAGPKLPEGFICGSQFGIQVQPQLFVNPKVIPAGSITSWNDLLSPAYKGKLVGHDPRGGGGGQGTAISMIYGLGEDFFVKLYKDQGVTLSRDYRQICDWVARGDYPIGIGISNDIVAEYQAQGLPIERIFPTNGPDALTTGSAGISLMKNSPHPNAAKLFTNWLLTKEGQQIWERATQSPSLRNDTGHPNVVSWVIPDPNTTYKLHDGTPDFYFNHRAQIVDRIQDILGR